MTLGDAALEREVLSMFVAQSDRLVGAMLSLPPNARELAHTLKGSARAVGAFAVAEAADRLEAALASGGKPSEPLDELGAAAAEARAAIAEILGEP